MIDDDRRAARLFSDKSAYENLRRDGAMNAEQIRQAEAVIRENLKEEYEARDAVVKKAAALESIVNLSIAALKDHAPSLADMLLVEARKVFKEK